MENLSILVYLGGFAFVALGAYQIGKVFQIFHLPLISGYLFAGILAGPFVFNFITTEMASELIYIDEVSLGFITFAVGSELYLRELSNRLKSIAWITVGLVISVYTLMVIAVFVLSEHIPFMQELSVNGKIAVAILIGAIMVARSPSSAIAIINELRARGPFTKTVLGVTVIMDVVVIVFFAFNTTLADTLLTNDSPDLGFFVLLLVELVLSLLLGYILGLIVQLILSTRLNQIVKTVFILGLGLGVFELARMIGDFSHEHLPFELILEPLLITMVASFYVTNFTRYRPEWMEIIHNAGPPIFVVFFTLTGSVLALDVLVALWPIALTLFAVRLLGVFVGTFTGGLIAKEPMRYNRLGWMAFVTQAGIGLGLAKDVVVEYPEFGAALATLVIAMIVPSEIVGPPLFKTAIKKLGEAHVPGRESKSDGIRDALILGIEGQSRALARQLQAQDWHVIMADTDATHVNDPQGEDISEYHIPEISKQTLQDLITPATDALVAMMGNDEANYEACALAYEIGIPRLIVRLNNLSWAERFSEYNALVVYPSSAIVHLLDQFVRAPQTTAMLLHEDPDHDIVQITLTDPDIDGILLRELRLPGDVLVLGLARDGHSIVPHGHTILHINDEVTLVGGRQSIEEVILRVGY